jgi:hypothetical protein
VVRICRAASDVWLGNINLPEQYASLVEWASQSKSAGAFLPLPGDFDSLRFNPFRPMNNRGTQKWTKILPAAAFCWQGGAAKLFNGSLVPGADAMMAPRYL